jgi:phosphatidylinositol dimannoside acyltransferase
VAQQVAVQPVPALGERKREVATYAAYRAGEWIVNALPRRLVLAVAAAAGNVAYDLAPEKRQLVCENLSRPMSLPPDHPKVRSAARRAFRAYAKYLADMMRLPSVTPHVAVQLVQIENVEILEEARRHGGGVIVCTVHVGGMDLLGPALHIAGETFHVVADDTTYGRLYDHLAAIRARHGVTLIGWRALRGVFRVLREGGTIALFCDGGYRPGDVPVEFCGEATTFPVGPATLAARSGSPLVPVACKRTADDRFYAAGMPLIAVDGADPASIQRATQRLADDLTAVIRSDPGQWYMFRRVWPRTDEERASARAALEAARAGENWTRRSAS